MSVSDSWFFKRAKQQEQKQMADNDDEDISPSESLTQSLAQMREHNATAQPVPNFEREAGSG